MRSRAALSRRRCKGAGDRFRHRQRLPGRQQGLQAGGSQLSAQGFERPGGFSRVVLGGEGSGRVAQPAGRAQEAGSLLVAPPGGDGRSNAGQLCSHGRLQAQVLPGEERLPVQLKGGITVSQAPLEVGQLGTRQAGMEAVLAAGEQVHALTQVGTGRVPFPAHHRQLSLAEHGAGHRPHTSDLP